MSSQTRSQTRLGNPVKLAVDAVILVGFLVSMEPHLTGVPLHEWLTLAGAAVFITHLLLNWNWIAQITSIPI